MLIGPDEAARGEVIVKCMKTGEQAAHPEGSLVTAVQSIISSHAIDATATE